MKRSKDFVEGYIAALKDYAWPDNRGKVLRVGIKGILLTDAIAKIEGEVEPENVEVMVIKDLVSHEERTKLNHHKKEEVIKEEIPVRSHHKK